MSGTPRDYKNLSPREKRELAKANVAEAWQVVRRVLQTVFSDENYGDYLKLVSRFTAMAPEQTLGLFAANRRALFAESYKGWRDLAENYFGPSSRMILKPSHKRVSLLCPACISVPVDIAEGQGSTPNRRVSAPALGWQVCFIYDDSQTTDIPFEMEGDRMTELFSDRQQEFLFCVLAVLWRQAGETSAAESISSPVRISGESCYHSKSKSIIFPEQLFKEERYEDLIKESVSFLAKSFIGEEKELIFKDSELNRLAAESVQSVVLNHYGFRCEEILTEDRQALCSLSESDKLLFLLLVQKVSSDLIEEIKVELEKELSRLQEEIEFFWEDDLTFFDSDGGVIYHEEGEGM